MYTYMYVCMYVDVHVRTVYIRKMMYNTHVYYMEVYVSQ